MLLSRWRGWLTAGYVLKATGRDASAAPDNAKRDAPLFQETAFRGFYHLLLLLTSSTTALQLMLQHFSRSLVALKAPTQSSAIPTPTALGLSTRHMIALSRTSQDNQICPHIPACLSSRLQLELSAHKTTRNYQVPTYLTLLPYILRL